MQKKYIDGDAGYRSPYLSHAKRALYHLSYIPIDVHSMFVKYISSIIFILNPPHCSFDMSGVSCF